MFMYFLLLSTTERKINMQQKSLSKILMGTAMIGFFGIFSSNEVAQALDCSIFNDQKACLSHSECGWLHSPENPEMGNCVENYLHNL
jgi:hypothetical protein